MESLSTELNEVYFAEFSKVTAEEKSQPFPEFAVHSDDVFVSHASHMLLYFNASEYVSLIGLSDRYQRAGRPLTASEQTKIENEWLGLNHESLRDSISGTELKWKVHLIAEGQLARLSLSTRDMRKSFGFLECWLCAASRIFDSKVLKPLFDFLPQLYRHAKQMKEALDRNDGRLSDQDLVYRGDVLYTRLSALLVRARRTAFPGCYKLRNEDFNWTKLIDPVTGDRLVTFPDRDGKVTECLMDWYGTTCSFRPEGEGGGKVEGKKRVLELDSDTETRSPYWRTIPSIVRDEAPANNIL
jgi:hypothetical protein